MEAENAGIKQCNDEGGEQQFERKTKRKFPEVSPQISRQELKSDRQQRNRSERIAKPPQQYFKPFRIIAGTLAKVSTLLIKVGNCKKPCWAG